MSVPSDRLYHFIENIAQEIYKDSVIIYRFWPNGSKNIENLNRLHDASPWVKNMSSPAIWCHDQEPLNYEYYSINLKKQTGYAWMDLLTSIGMNIPLKNLNWSSNWFEKNLLLHSEQRSQNLMQYQNNTDLVPVYYWNHALLAIDWFRYAKHANFNKRIEKTFLIYNRAWGGTREYRLKFIDSLIEFDLVDACQTNFNPLDPESSTHYNDHVFCNESWKPQHKLENYFAPTKADSSSSADFNESDYQKTEIEIVLETLYDDNRLHLTEKILRPIACGQPFLLASTHGSLEYLRQYGFKTFDSVWSEQYDTVADPNLRLSCIMQTMCEINSWDSVTRREKIKQANEIACFNRDHFFSEAFSDKIVTELKTNLQTAFDIMLSCQNYQPWIDRYEQLLSYPQIVQYLKNNNNQFDPNLQTVNLLIRSAKIITAHKTQTK